MGIECIVSSETLSLHRAHLDALRAKKRMGLNMSKDLDADIQSHVLYFSSFCRERMRCERIRKGYGSENAFVFELKEYAERQSACFLYIFPLHRFPYVGFSASAKDIRRTVLCIDLFEHAYFLDYGFDRSAYLTAALSHLDLSVFDKE